MCIDVVDILKAGSTQIIGYFKIKILLYKRTTTVTNEI